MDINELYEKKLTNSEVILDVRTKEEYENGHIPGSRNIPLDEVEEKTEDIKDYTTVYIHCEMGGRASRAYDKLVNKGLTDLVCVSEGMFHWTSRGYPIEN